MNNQAAKIKTIANWLGKGSLNVFGMPFAGKDTQGHKLADFFGAVLIGGGDILRSTEVPQRVKDIMNTGQLIPTEDYLKIITPYLSSPDFKGKPLVLSSVGRWKGEETVIAEATQQAGHPLRAVIMLNLTEEQVKQRWQNFKDKKGRQGRVDDSGEIIKTRIEEFRFKTQPVIEFYKHKGLLLEVNGNKSPEEVTELILESLYIKAQQD